MEDSANSNPQNKKEKMIDEHFLHMRKMFMGELGDQTEISEKIIAQLKLIGIKTLGDLVSRNKDDIQKSANLDAASLAEIEEAVDMRGLHFGMDITDWELEGD